MWEGEATEAIAYGPADAADLVMSLVIDDGLAGRPHRRQILDRRLRTIGVACGPHKTFKTMCVITYAGRFREATKAGQRDRLSRSSTVRYP